MRQLLIPTPVLAAAPHMLTGLPRVLVVVPLLLTGLPRAFVVVRAC